MLMQQKSTRCKEKMGGVSNLIFVVVYLPHTQELVPQVTPELQLKATF